MTRILLIEDSPTQAQDIQNQLEEFGYDVTWYRNAGDAVYRLSREPQFDYCVVDYDLPGVTMSSLCDMVKWLHGGAMVMFTEYYERAAEACHKSGVTVVDKKDGVPAMVEKLMEAGDE